MVLGSGGNAAYAWEVGVIAGMAEAGLEVGNADLFVGTSAGARVAVELASGTPPGELLKTQVSAMPQTEAMPQVDLKQWRDAVTRAKQGVSDRVEILRRVGMLALSTAPELGAGRRSSLASLLSTKIWPSRKLLLVTVEAETGLRTVFDASSGIKLLDAVVASGAVAGIYPPAQFLGHHYFDGGFYSAENADVAIGSDRVLILTLRPGPAPLGVVSLQESLESMRARDVEVQVIHPDEATEAAFSSVKGNVLDPSVAGPAARAGRAQGYRLIGDGEVLVWP